MFFKKAIVCFILLFITKNIFATSFLISTSPTGWEGSQEKQLKTKIFEISRYRILGSANVGYNYSPDLTWVDFAKQYNPSLLIRSYDNLPYIALGYRNMVGMDFSRYDAMWRFLEQNPDVFVSSGPAWHKFEDFFLHWQGDTVIIPKGAGYNREINGEKNLAFPQDARLFELNRILVKKKDGKWIDLLSNGYIATDFNFPNLDEELYIGSLTPEEVIKFDIKSSSSNDYRGRWEYCSLVDSNKNCLNWSVLSLIEDTTDNFKKSGYIRWQPPINWQRSFINALYPAFYLRFRVIADGTAPVIKAGGILRGNYVKEVYLENGNYVWAWPGWDERNDRNKDGYIDDNEYQNLINKNATARLKWQARKPAFIYSPFSPGIGYLPRMGSAFSTPYGKFILETILNNVFKKSANGYSIDAIFLDNVVDYIGLDEKYFYSQTNLELIDGRTFYSNGLTLEYEGDFQTMKNLWFADYVKLVTDIHNALNNNNKFLIVNSWHKSQEKFVENTDFVFLEGIIGSNLNWVGWLQRQRQFQKWSRLAKKGVLMQYFYRLAGMLTNDNPSLETRDMYDRDKILALATFLAFRSIDKDDYLFPWQGLWYGSGDIKSGYWASNTPEYFDYNLPPTPKTVAFYIPAAEYNFGKPTGIVPFGFEAPAGDWYGEKTQNGLYVFQSGIDPVLKDRTDISENNKRYFIFGRDFVNGIKVLIRPLPTVLAKDPKGLMSDYQYTLSDFSTVQINLSAKFRLLNADGSVSTFPVDKIFLRNGEAAILIPEEGYQQIITDIKKYFKISLFADKYNPLPGDIITYRAVLKNISTTTLIRTKFYFPLATDQDYILDSAYLKISTTKHYTISYRSHKLIITLPYLQPQQEATLIWKMRKK